jgi:hypothetical protein
MNRIARARLFPVLLAGLLGLPFASSAMGQDRPRPSLEAGALLPGLSVDGRLEEELWRDVPVITGLTMIEPDEGGVPVGQTTVRVLVSPLAIVFGIVCEDPDPIGIVSFSKARDPELRREDYVKILLDTFLDGRSGYIFALNPGGARYDALVTDQGERDNTQWDAVWEAATARGPYGWSAEIRIPIQSLAFRAGLTEWGFNVERRTERLQEVSRWASPTRDARVSQPSRAGRLHGLPAFDQGEGLSIRPALVTGLERPEPGASTDGAVEPSLDVFRRLGSNTIASLTVNTDFAETEVDTRRTNLTRFPLFFPEKRTFFLEGADIFDFVIGLQTFFRPDLVPFFSRRIGLFEGSEVPLVLGGKSNGRVGQTNFGVLAVHTRQVDTLVPAATMGAARIKQNVLRESSIGVIATAGDPEGRPDSWMAGADATYQTSRLFGDKNFLVGAWGLTTDRADLTGDKTAFGAKIDYPNDTWDVSMTYKRIGDGFDPSLSFVPRAAVQVASGGLNYRLRPSWTWIRHMFFEFRPSVALDLHGRWESYRMFTAPLNWQLESGERVELNVFIEGERLIEPFEIAEGVVIPPGTYDWVRYRQFYDGTLDELSVRAVVRVSHTVLVELGGQQNNGHLPQGDFVQRLVNGRIQLNFSPDLQLNGFVQYDNASKLLGSNTRLRWTFHPLGDVFVVYNHNLSEQTGSWLHDSNQLIVKLQYALRY